MCISFLRQLHVPGKFFEIHMRTGTPRVSCDAGDLGGPAARLARGVTTGL
nr:MAG TPA: hypothetical protein [Inoviridae sp.]